MKKIVVCPSSFKGFLSPFSAAEVMAQTALKIFPNATVISLPLPDGGEGTLQAFLNAGYSKRALTVRGPEGTPITVAYGLRADHAFIESAECLALSLVIHHDPRHTTSYGIGEMILDAISCGAKDITISLGGTCSNDGGTGMALALGAQFMSHHRLFSEMHGSLLEKIDIINETALKEKIHGIIFHAIADVNNPLTGPNGASLVYGPQKGASEEEANELDLGMRHYANLLAHQIGRDDSLTPGTGAAGGLGFACLHFLNADISSGCEKIMAINHFDEQIQGADLLVTGEGKLDRQSLMGKSLSHILLHKKSLPLWVIAGSVELSDEEQKKAGIALAYSLKPVEETPLNPERVKAALFRVTYDALMRKAQEDAEKNREMKRKTKIV